VVAPPNACAVTVILHDDVKQALNMAKPYIAFYIGGMGAKEKNFHLDLIGRFGFAEEARRVQELFLSGKRAEVEASAAYEAPKSSKD
jgi:hypothetical protein